MADDRKMIEQQLRTLVLEPDLKDIKPFSQMREEVLSQACARLVAERQKTKARLRAARRVALATACLMVGVCIFSVLAPVPAGTAGSILHQARVWINNVLNISVRTELNHESEPTPGSTAPQQSYDTLEAASAACGLTLYRPVKAPESTKLGEVKVNWADGTLVNASYSYQGGKEKIYFTVSPLADEIGIAIPAENVFIYETPVGSFHVFTTEKNIRAVSVTRDAIISIKSTQDKEAFLALLDTLEAVR